MSLKKYKSQGKATELTVNNRKEDSYNFCLDFVQELASFCHFNTPHLLCFQQWGEEERRVGGGGGRRGGEGEPLQHCHPHQVLAEEAHHGGGDWQQQQH